MNFFVASEGLNGNSVDLAAASAQCKSLAANVDQGDKNWVGFGYAGADHSSITNTFGEKVWYNASGEVLAASTGDLFSTASNVTNATAISERGQALDSESQSTKIDLKTKRLDNLFYCLESM
jgi:hypothetical protein